MVSSRVAAFFGDSAASTVTSAGGKGAKLSQMSRAGLPVPPGFVIVSDVFAEYLKGKGIAQPISALLASIQGAEPAELEKVSTQIRDLILTASLPPAVATALEEACAELWDGAACPVAVRSSAIAEDGASSSSAGQQETFLNVIGAGEVLQRVRDCWISFFSSRALFYRSRRGDVSDLGMAVVVQRMIASEKSGVLFTVDPVEKRRDRLVIEAVMGLGEGLVSGEITPDHYELNRSDGSLAAEYVPAKMEAMVAGPGDAGVIRINIEHLGQQRVLNASETTHLWSLGMQTEELFGSPQDIEWAIRGGETYLLQSRPITTL